MPVHLEIRFGGGYAFIDNRARDQFDVASIPPAHPTHVKHPLIVTLSGAAAPARVASRDGSEVNALRLNLDDLRARMEVWPGGAVPGGPLTPPDRDDRHELLPDVPELGRSALADDWRDRIASRITLREGRVHVDRQHLAKGAFEFRHPTRSSRPRQRMPNGLNGIVYRLSDGSPSVNTVTLALFPLSVTDHDIVSGAVRPNATYELSPRSGSSIAIRVDSDEIPKEITDGMDLEEFGVFYHLLDPQPALNDQYIPRWFGNPLDVLSPGSECPPGFYDDWSR